MNEDRRHHCKLCIRTRVIDPAEIPTIVGDETLSNGAGQVVYERLEQPTHLFKDGNDLGGRRERKGRSGRGLGCTAGVGIPLA